MHTMRYYCMHDECSNMCRKRVLDVAMYCMYMCRWRVCVTGPDCLLLNVGRMKYVASWALLNDQAIIKHHPLLPIVHTAGLWAVS